MKEGNLEAPTRRPLDWRNPDFYDPAKLDAEMRRVFEICHGCRRCFNLCDSFPRLFDLVDAAGDAEMKGVASADFKKVVDACTLCDMCFLTKCPYVPPHEFDLDFPHLMVRYRAAARKQGEGAGFMERQLSETDRNGKLSCMVAPLANWASDERNGLTRPILEKVAGVDREARLPKFTGQPLTAQKEAPAPNPDGPARNRKAVIFATCFANYNKPEIGLAAQAVLARQGIAAEFAYPGCCGMPQLEQGDLGRVAESAERTAAFFASYIDQGYDVISLVSSCGLMLKLEWPLIVPENHAVKRLAAASWDIAEYLVDIARKEGLAPGMSPLEGGVAMHLACHARAQNVGPRGAELVKLIPETPVTVVERCSGHGGAWGIRKGNFEVALKVGKPAARQMAKAAKAHVASECPLACDHLLQGMERLEGGAPVPNRAWHPIELMARAYGL